MQYGHAYLQQAYFVAVDIWRYGFEHLTSQAVMPSSVLTYGKEYELQVYVKFGKGGLRHAPHWQQPWPDVSV